MTDQPSNTENVPDGPGEMRGPLPPPHLVAPIQRAAEPYGATVTFERDKA